MKAYTTILKILGLLVLIPIVLSAVIWLGVIGLSLDFSNDSGGSMYFLILPLSFIVIGVWAVYKFFKR